MRVVAVGLFLTQVAVAQEQLLRRDIGVPLKFQASKFQPRVISHVASLRDVLTNNVSVHVTSNNQVDRPAATAAASPWDEQGAAGAELGEEDHKEGEEQIVAYISFLLLSLLGAAVLEWLISLIPHYTFPASIAWFLFGMALDFLGTKLTSKNPIMEGVRYIGTLDAEIVYLAFLPILLYEAALNVDWHKFKRFAISGLTLAIFGVGYQVALVGVLIQVTFPSSSLLWNPSSWFNSFLIGSALASTDPVAVISVLTSLQAPPKLSTMFDGESLINDGTSMLFFTFFRSLTHGENQTAGEVISRFAVLLLVSPLWGIAACYLCYIWMRRCRHSAPSLSIAPLAVAYAVYLLAEKAFRASGPLAVVAYGIAWNAFGHIGLERHAQEHHHHAVTALATLANSAVFVVAGVVAMRMMEDALKSGDGVGHYEMWNVPILYLYLMLARILMILTCLPILRRTGYGCNWKESVLLVWGGLRGAIVLAMGLMIEQDHEILNFMRYEAVLYIAGSTFLILLINGATFELLYNLLTPYPPKPFRRVYLEKIMKLVDLQYMHEKEVLEEHWLFRNTDVIKVADKTAPILGWRKMDERGRINVSLPSIGSAFQTPPDFSKWQPPVDPDIVGQEGGTDHDLYKQCSSTTNMPNRGVADIPGILDDKLKMEVAASQMGNTVQNMATIKDSATASNGGDVPAAQQSPPTVEQSSVLSPPSIEIKRVGGPTAIAGDANERAHNVTSSALGLRNAKGASFDAKYYLRLLEHATEPLGDQQPAHPDHLAVPTTSDNAIHRFDTDRTLILPQYSLEEAAVQPQPMKSKLRKILSVGLGGGNAEESPVESRSNSIKFRSDDRARGSVADDASLDERYNQQDVKENRTTGSKQIQNETQHQSAIDGTPAKVHGFVVPSSNSEPFGSTRLNVGRMTRLRRPEWDQRGYSRFSGIPEAVPHVVTEDWNRHSVVTPFTVVNRTPGGSAVPAVTPASAPAKDPYASENLMHPDRMGPETVNRSGGDTRVRALYRLKHRLRGAGAKKSGGSRPPQDNMPFRVSSAPLVGAKETTLNNTTTDQDNVSIASYEDYLDMPSTPARLSLAYGGASAAARVKVLRKEREGELFIMVFNAIKQMYAKLYSQHFIGGSAMLSLSHSLDHAVDFAIGKLRRNHVRAWNDVLAVVPEEVDWEPVPGNPDEMTGFEFEWRALVMKLKCVDRRNVVGRFLQRVCPNQDWMKAAVTYSSARCDLEQVAAYVDVHEELLFKGGTSFAELLGPKLLHNYKLQIQDAKKFVLVLRAAYPQAFKYAVAVHASTLLIHLKKQLVEEQFEKGLILDEDFKMFIELLEEQIQNLEAFGPGGNLGLFFQFLRSRLMCCRSKKVEPAPDESKLRAITTTQGDPVENF